MTIPQYEFMIQLFTMARMGAGQKLVPPEFEILIPQLKKNASAVDQKNHAFDEAAKFF